jgi:hypothetical protein
MFNNNQNIDFSAYGATVQKLIELNTATMTKAFELQQAAFEKQIAQSQADFKAAAEIKDAKDLTDFITAQAETAKKNLETLQADAQVAVESSKAYFDELQTILTESTDAIVKGAAPKK